MSSDFSLMLQNPKLALREPELQKCTIARNDMNQPRPWTGSFAVVFKGVRPDGTAVALRAFTSESPDRQSRYLETSNHLNSVTLPCLVNFKFQEKGIRAVNGKWYPLVEMEWVQGVTLFEWVDARCREANGAALTRIAEQWTKMIEGMQAAGIAHGDLQHGNVMVTDAGELKLVDYDCMCVPKLIGRPNLEIGVEPYQHPSRNEKTLLSPVLDDFSALFILVVMKALGADPSLWGRYQQRAGEDKAYDKLLLRKEDMDQGPASPLCKDLLSSRDPDVRTLTQQLLDGWKGPVEKVVRLSDALNSFKKIEEALDARDWDAAFSLIEQKTIPQRAKAPPALQKRIAEAQDRVRCREALESAAAKGDESELARLYAPRLVDDYARAQPVARLAQTAAKVVPLLLQFAELGKKQDGRGLAALWDANQAMLANRVSTNSVKGIVDGWRKRNRACDEFLAKLKQQGDAAPATLAAWEALEAAGGHPECAAYRTKMQNLATRQLAWSAWQRIDAAVAEGTDQQRVDLWKEPLFAGWPPAEQERGRLNEARKRLELVRRLQELDRQLGSSLTLDGERRLIEGARALDGYAHGVQQRVLLARERVEAEKQWTQNFNALGREKQALAAWQKLVQLDATSLVPANHQNLGHLLAQRIAALEILVKIPLAAAEATDSAFVRAWKEDLFAGWPEAERHRPRLNEAKSRLAIMQQLRQLDPQVGNAGSTLEREEKYIQIGRPLSDLGYAHGLSGRVARIQERVETARSLIREAGSPRPSELSLAEKWRRLEALDGTSLVPDKARERAQLARVREPHLISLLELSDDLTVKEMDQQVLRLWKQELEGCAEAAKWQPRFEEAKDRERLVQSLAKCITEGDDWGIAQTTANPLLKGYLLPGDWHEPIQMARERYTKARAIVQAFKANDIEAFYKAFDAAIVRRFKDRFARLDPEFVRMVDTLIADPARLRLELPPYGQAAIVPLGEDTYKLCWKWPESRFTDTCALAVCRTRPKETDRDPGPVQKLVEQTIQKREYELGNGNYRLHAEASWRGHFVAIWAVIDLGFTILYGKPLILGGLTGAASVHGQSRRR